MDQLDRIRIATPCKARWDRMKGDDQVRFCAACKLNVYNLSNMTRQEAIDLVEKTEGRMCARFYRRKDGTILTRDCPVGKQKLFDLRVRWFAGVATAFALFFEVLRFAKAGEAPREWLQGDIKGKVEVKEESSARVGRISER